MRGQKEKTAKEYLMDKILLAGGLLKGGARYNNMDSREGILRSLLHLPRKALEE